MCFVENVLPYVSSISFYVASTVNMVRRHNLSVSITKFRNLLLEVTVLEDKVSDIDLNILDGIENPKYARLESPPRAAALMLSDVRLVFTKNFKPYVIQPQGYNSVLKLTKRDDMVNMVKKRNELRNKFELGLFHTGLSGIAQSGDGGDGGDKWYLANDAMYNYLKSKLSFLKKELRNRTPR